MPAGPLLLLFRSAILVLVLSASSLVTAASEPIAEERTKQAFVASTATVGVTAIGAWPVTLGTVAATSTLRLSPLTDSV